jgi:hypothetical protein
MGGSRGRAVSASRACLGVLRQEFVGPGPYPPGMSMMLIQIPPQVADLAHYFGTSVRRSNLADALNPYREFLNGIPSPAGTDEMPAKA